MKRNWLTENITSILALMLIALGITIDVLVLLKEVKASESTAITVIQNVNNMMLVVISFYYVSSVKAKQEAGPPKPEITIKNEESSNTTINSSSTTQ